MPEQMYSNPFAGQFGSSYAPRVVSTKTLPGKGGTGSTGPKIDIQKMLSQVQGQADAANKANMQRYQALLDQVSGLQTSVLGPQGPFAQMQNLAATMGQTQQQDINRRATQEQAQSEQSLISRGLGNTTVRSAARRGIAADAGRARAGVAEQVTGQQIGILGQQTGAQMDLGRLMSDAILSRVDQGPNMEAMMQLISQIAAMGGTR
jgi:hypothetical protein